MKKIWPGVCILLMPSLLISQNLLNRVYDFGFPGNTFRNLIIKSDTIIGYGVARQKTPPYQLCLLFSRFDSSGHMIDTLLICDPQGGAYSTDANGDDMKLTTDGGLAVLGSNLSKRIDLFIKFDKNFQLEFVKKLEDSTSLTPYSNTIIEVADGYWISGFAQRNNYFLDAFARKVDKFGNTIWLKHYGDSLYDDILRDYIQAGDSIVLGVGGYKVTDCDSAHCYGPWIMQFDMEGNVLKEWKRDTSHPLNVGWFVFPVDEKNWLITGRASIADTPEGRLSGNYSAIIDTGFNLKKIDYFETNVSMDRYFHNFAAIDGGNYLGVGQFFVPEGNLGRDKGWLVKLNSDGDTIWTRVIEPGLIAGELPTESVLGGSGLLSSGNIVAGGYSEVGNKAYCWLVKITPDGCVDTLLCNPVSMDEPEVIENRETRIFPNPSNGIVTVLFPETIGAQELLLYTLTNSCVFAQKLSSPGPVNLTNLPSGAYLAELRSEGGLRFRTKLLLFR